MKIKIEKLLKQKLKSRYWLGRQLGMSDYNLKRMMRGETKGIKFETLEALCQILECTPNDLFEIE